jgi:hypothetical protein
MAAVNGDGPHLELERDVSKHLGKRKRSTSLEKKVHVNGDNKKKSLQDTLRAVLHRSSE